MTRRPPSDRPYRRIQQPYVTHCVLCDGVMVGSDGAITIDRIVDEWRIADHDPPVNITCWVAVSIRGIPADALTARMQFSRESDGMVVGLYDVELAGVGESINFNIEAPRIPIPTFGDYRLSALYKGREIGSFPFSVVGVQSSETERVRNRETAS